MWKKNLENPIFFILIVNSLSSFGQSTPSCPLNSCSYYQNYHPELTNHGTFYDDFQPISSAGFCPALLSSSCCDSNVISAMYNVFFVTYNNSMHKKCDLQFNETFGALKKDAKYLKDGYEYFQNKTEHYNNMLNDPSVSAKGKTKINDWKTFFNTVGPEIPEYLGQFETLEKEKFAFEMFSYQKLTEFLCRTCDPSCQENEFFKDQTSGNHGASAQFITDFDSKFKSYNLAAKNVIDKYQFIVKNYLAMTYATCAGPTEKAKLCHNKCIESTDSCNDDRNQFLSQVFSESGAMRAFCGVRVALSGDCQAGQGSSRRFLQRGKSGMNYLEGLKEIN